MFPPNVKRRIFFSGKGGVGKTTLATATAVAGAGAGYRTLLVTTDPAAHTGWVLETTVDTVPRPVADVPGLYVARIDPAWETAEYQRKVLEEAAHHYPTDTLLRLQEELASPCTEEVAVFHRFLDLLLSDEWPLVVFDTAPTGHTLRLLELPLSYRQQLSVKVAGLGPTETDAGEVARIADALSLLRGPSTKMAFVLYPEATPILEARRAIAELDTVGIHATHVMVNHVLPEEVLADPLFGARYHMQQQYLERLRKDFPDEQMVTVPLMAHDVIGLTAVHELNEFVFSEGFDTLWGFSMSDSAVAENL
ncbi:arsenite efflux ATP-binding protein ArsA (TC 3.A.4.1.1) [Sulfobacillus acidophilus TPY]|uniref:Arsenite efflux ATP-binding protein ArsA n=1 Tax=Sulfobacillus acidophilus (strain ATCC 700253 / DSM 10332 / NAL) TaxID=679936 RepID=G8TTU2_SULAD|nr:arsenite efflux ATP-binding protein ArsA (TC 3.A.4.1.1) [Sulfobacillus acidophilus TPY]AEW06851.1 arsenite efflux ATP-binding protein ArsA [Sulfobacillus acidophilus DSM 10332]